MFEVKIGKMKMVRPIDYVNTNDSRSFPSVVAGFANLFGGSDKHQRPKINVAQAKVLTRGDDIKVEVSHALRVVAANMLARSGRNIVQVQSAIDAYQMWTGGETARPLAIEHGAEGHSESSPFTTDEYAINRTHAFLTMDNLRAHQLLMVSTANFNFEHVEFALLVQTIVKTAFLMRRDLDEAIRAATEKVLGPLKKMISETYDGTRGNKEQNTLPFEFHQLRRIGLSEMDRLIMVTPGWNSDVPQQSLLDPLAMDVDVGRVGVDNILKNGVSERVLREMRSRVAGFQRTVIADSYAGGDGGFSAPRFPARVINILRTLEDVKAFQTRQGTDADDKRIANFVAFVPMDKFFLMSSVDSVVEKQSTADAELALEVFENQLSTSARFTALVIRDYLDPTLNQVAKQTRCLENINSCIKNELRMFPVVRSVYGLLLPSWMVSNNKWE